MKVLQRLYLAWVAVLVAGCAAAWTTGWEPFAGKRGMIPQNVRQAPGGYRSYHFWQGGK
jgi:hypothetical protein